MRIDRRNDLNIRMLEVFGAAMRYLTTVAAAEALGISQPAVSNAIKGLEKKLGFTLFDRTSQGLIPTEEARLVYDECEPIFTMMRDLESQIQAVRSTRKGRLSIAATPPLSQSVIPLALKSFLKERKDVRVKYDVRGIGAVLQSIENGTADVGLVLGVDSHPGCEIIPLFEDAMDCVMLPDHPLVARKYVTPDDIVNHDYVGIGLDHQSRLGNLVQAAFLRCGVPLETNIRVRNCHTACVLTSAGLGMSIVDPFTSRFMKSDDLVCKPFRPEIKVSAVAVVRDSKPMSRVANAFINELKSILRGDF